MSRKQLQEESKFEFRLDTRSNPSSGEESKAVEVANEKYLDTMSSASSEMPPLCQRCSSDDATIVCKSCGNIMLCESCEDLIHSIGIYESHNRVSIEEYENPENILHNETVNSEIELNLDAKTQTIKNNKLDGYKPKGLTIKTDDYNDNSDKLREIINNLSGAEVKLSMANSKEFARAIETKAQELCDNMETYRTQKLDEIESEKTKLSQLDDKVGDVCQVLQKCAINPSLLINIVQRLLNQSSEPQNDSTAD